MPKFLLVFATETQPINKISEMKSAAFSKFLQTTFGFDSNKHSIRTEVMAGKKGNVPNLKKTFMVDAIATTAGAIMGSSTVTTFVESAAGVTPEVVPD